MSSTWARRRQSKERTEQNNPFLRYTLIGLVSNRRSHVELAGEASVNFYYLTDLNRVVDRFGDRGYRAAQLEGGILGGKVYLAAYALGCGATGLTFLDDDVTDFFSPDAAGKAVMFLIAVGRPARRTRKAG